MVEYRRTKWQRPIKDWEGEKAALRILLDGFLWVATWIIVLVNWGLGWEADMREMLIGVEWAARPITIGEVLTAGVAVGMFSLSVFWPVAWWAIGKVKGPKALEGKVNLGSTRLWIFALAIIISVVF